MKLRLFCPSNALPQEIGCNFGDDLLNCDVAGISLESYFITLTCCETFETFLKLFDLRAGPRIYDTRNCYSSLAIPPCHRKNSNKRALLNTKQNISNSQRQRNRRLMCGGPILSVRFFAGKSNCQMPRNRRLTRGGPRPYVRCLRWQMERRVISIL